MKPMSYLEAALYEQLEFVHVPFSFLHRSPITGAVYQMTDIGGNRFLNAEHWEIYYVTTEAAKRTFKANSISDE